MTLKFKIKVSFWTNWWVELNHNNLKSLQKIKNIIKIILKSLIIICKLIFLTQTHSHKI
jgi:hypothetical protein